MKRQFTGAIGPALLSAALMLQAGASLESSAEGNMQVALSKWREDRAAGRPFRPDRWWLTEPAMTESKCDGPLPTAEILLTLAMNDTSW